MSMEYLLQKQCARQWRSFLDAMSAEFAAQLPVDDLRVLMRRIGIRFAQSASLPACETVEQIRDAANRIWEEVDWGYVDMEEGDGYLRLIHRYAPLGAFGEEALTWSPSFLEGVYQQWFVSCGAGDELGLRQATDYDAAGVIEYRLSLQ
jgi:hypothetical protein